MMGCDQNGGFSQLITKGWLLQHRQPAILFQVAREQYLERPELEEDDEAQVVRVIEAWIRIAKCGRRDAAHVLIERRIKRMDIVVMKGQIRMALT